jgi:hypothetical protein
MSALAGPKLSPLSLELSPASVPILQASPLAVAGTVGSLIVLLTVTAHIAARNVLEDVPAQNALGVGPVVAPFATLPEAFGVPPALAIGLAIVADFLAITYLYGRGWRLSAYLTLIHVVVSVLLGTLLVSAFLLLTSAPG